jgi:hypothetical protein
MNVRTAIHLQSNPEFLPLLASKTTWITIHLSSTSTRQPRYRSYTPRQRKRARVRTDWQCLPGYGVGRWGMPFSKSNARSAMNEIRLGNQAHNEPTRGKRQMKPREENDETMIRRISTHWNSVLRFIKWATFLEGTSVSDVLGSSGSFSYCC